VLLLGTALRFHGLGDKSLWVDEILQVSVASNSVPRIWEIALPYSAGALDLFVTHLALTLGESEFLVRFPPAFFGVVSIALIYAVGRRLFGPTTGLLASLLLALSAYHVRYSQEARAYSLLVLLTLLSMWFFLAVMRRSTLLNWVGWVAATALGLYTHFSMLVVVAAQAGTAGILWFKERRAMNLATPAHSPIVPPSSRGAFGGRLLLGLILIVLLWLPDVVPAMRDATTIHLADRDDTLRPLGALDTGSSTTDLQAKLLTGLQGLASSLTREFSGSSGNVPVFTVLLGVGVLGAWLARRGTSFWLNLLILIPPLAAAPFRFSLTPRYFIFMLPSFVMLVALGIETLVKAADRLAKLREWPGSGAMSRVVLIALITLLVALSVSPLRTAYGKVKQNWRGAATLLQHHLQPSDAAVGLRWSAGTVKFYAPQLRVEELVDETAGGLSRLLQGHPRLWYIRASGLSGANSELEAWVREHGFATIDLGGVLVSLGSRDGEISQAEWQSLLEEAIDLFPTAGTAVALGDLYLEQNQVSEAVVQYRQAVELGPGLGMAHTRLGNAYRDEGNTQQAALAYEQAIRVDPEYVGAYMNLGGIHEMHGREDEALALYRAAVDMAPDSAWAHAGLGRIYVRLGESAEGLRHLEQSVELEPDRVLWLMRLANAYYELGHHDKAVTAYRQILTLDPDNPRAAEALDDLGP
jgi:tetratricopeptide (TPR) repeat protein